MGMGRCSAVLVALVALAVQTASAQPTQVRWCVPYDQPDAYANLCTEALSPANNDAVEFSCVVGLTSEGCAKLIAEGDAHLTTLDGGDMVKLNRETGLEALLFENYGAGVATSYYAVAAVNKGFCTATTTLESLKGLSSCHTGYRKTAGWYSPLGTLLSEGVMDAVSEEEDVEDDAESMAGFFSGICAPRTSGNGPKNGLDGEGESWDTLCELCRGDCSVHDAYYDYQGAFRCLVEGTGDVAFIKHSTIPDFAKGGPKEATWATKGSDEYMLVCRTGGCRPVEDYEECFLAKVPAHAIAAPASFSVGGVQAELGAAIQGALIAAAGQPGFLEGAIELGDQKNFIFKSGTTGLDAVTTSFEEAIGAEFLANFDAVEGLGEDDDGDK